MVCGEHSCWVLSEFIVSAKCTAQFILSQNVSDHGPGTPIRVALYDMYHWGKQWYRDFRSNGTKEVRNQGAYQMVGGAVGRQAMVKLETCAPGLRGYPRSFLARDWWELVAC